MPGREQREPGGDCAGAMGKTCRLGCPGALSSHVAAEVPRQVRS
jgi:hypothetical protein